MPYLGPTQMYLPPAKVEVPEPRTAQDRGEPVTLLPGLGATSTPPPIGDIAGIPGDPKAINAVVRLILERSGMSQAEIARRLGVKPQALDQYRTGRRINPSVSWLVRLAETCGASVVITWPPGRS